MTKGRYCVRVEQCSLCGRVVYEGVGETGCEIEIDVFIWKQVFCGRRRGVVRSDCSGLRECVSVAGYDCW